MNEKDAGPTSAIATLIIKYLQGNLQEVERKSLESWLQESETHRALLHTLRNENKTQESINYLNSIDKEAAIKRISRRINEQHTIHRLSLRSWKYIAAAMVLLIVSSAVMLYLTRVSRTTISPNDDISIRYKNDIRPGGNKAQLILANGHTVQLDAPADSSFMADNATLINKHNGVLTYSNNAAGVAAYNTVATPIGGTYKIVLSDGSQVWLNAGSSLRFPTHFTGKERRVLLSGEGYFSIAKNAQQTFIVATDNLEIQALGTAFNVMAYTTEEKSATTLAEGLVKVTYAHQSYTLHPGTAAVVSNNQVSVEPADVAAVTAWKEGLFIFKNTDVATVMQQLARWYNVKVSYIGDKTPDLHFTGEIDRNVTMAQILQMLELTGGVQFTIDKNNVTISQVNH